MFLKLKKSILKQDFYPTFLGLFVNPFYFARKGLLQHIAKLAPQVHGRTLDVGCGTKPYQRYCNASEYISLEIERTGKNADVYYDGKVFPFRDGEFDSILTTQVLEHVFNPNEFLIETNRVLKEGGILLLSVPFLWDEHEQPFDYARYSSFGIDHLLTCHGFEVIEHRKSMSDVRVIFQMINAYIYKKTMTHNPWLNLLTTLVLMTPFNLLGEVLHGFCPHNTDLYLDNIVLARKTQLKEREKGKEE